MVGQSHLQMLKRGCELGDMKGKAARGAPRTADLLHGLSVLSSRPPGDDRPEETPQHRRDEPGAHHDPALGVRG